MLNPGIHLKGFDKATLTRCILEYAPIESPVPSALAGEFGNGIQKFVSILRLNQIFDRHQHGSAVLEAWGHWAAGSSLVKSARKKLRHCA